MPSMVLSAFSASISSSSSASLVVSGGHKSGRRTRLLHKPCVCLRHKFAMQGYYPPAQRPVLVPAVRLQYAPELLSNFRAHLLRNRFTVNNLCCHQREDSICYVGRRGCAYFVRSGARCQVSFQIYHVKRPLAKVRRTVAEVAEIESFIFRP